MRPANRTVGRLTCKDCGGIKLVVVGLNDPLSPAFLCAARCNKSSRRKPIPLADRCEINEHLDACEKCDKPMTLRTLDRRCTDKRTPKVVGPVVARSQRSIGLHDLGSMQP